MGLSAYMNQVGRSPDLLAEQQRKAAKAYLDAMHKMEQAQFGLEFPEPPKEKGLSNGQGNTAVIGTLISGLLGGAEGASAFGSNYLQGVGQMNAREQQRQALMAQQEYDRKQKMLELQAKQQGDLYKYSMGEAERYGRDADQLRAELGRQEGRDQASLDRAIAGYRQNPSPELARVWRKYDPDTAPTEEEAKASQLMKRATDKRYASQEWQSVLNYYADKQGGIGFGDWWNLVAQRKEVADKWGVDPNSLTMPRQGKSQTGIKTESTVEKNKVIAQTAKQRADQFVAESKKRVEELIPSQVAKNNAQAAKASRPPSSGSGAPRTRIAPDGRIRVEAQIRLLDKELTRIAPYDRATGKRVTSDPEYYKELDARRRALQRSLAPTPTSKKATSGAKKYEMRNGKLVPVGG